VKYFHEMVSEFTDKNPGKLYNSNAYKRLSGYVLAKKHYL